MYKKFFLIFVSIIAVNLAKAQTEKGNKSLGLQFGIFTNNANSSSFDYNINSYGTQSIVKQRSYSIAPNYNYFIAAKLDIGVGLGYTYSSQTNNNTGFATQDQSGHSYFGTLQLRKYFLYDNKIGIRTGPYVSYQRFKQSYNYYNGAAQTENNTQSNVYTGGLGLDFVYYPLTRLGLAATLGNLSYNHQNTTGDTKGTYNIFNLSFVNTLALSVNYVFGK